MVYILTLAFFSHICLRFTEEYCARSRMIRRVELHVHIIHVLPVADVLQVAARVLPAQVCLGPVRLQPGMGISAQLGAGRHAAGRGVPHGASPRTPRLRPLWRLPCPSAAGTGSGGCALPRWHPERSGWFIGSSRDGRPWRLGAGHSHGKSRGRERGSSLLNHTSSPGTPAAAARTASARGCCCVHGKPAAAP